jgi:hypothetical protein
MPRTPPSHVDLGVIEAVRARGLSLSGAQLERWRRVGLVARNKRHGLGRGLGSASSAGPDVIDAATALAHFGRRGRALHRAVLDWFVWAGTPLRGTDDVIVIEPPIDAVRSALRWAATHGPVARLGASIAGTSEDDIDRAYALAHRMGRRLPMPWPGVSDQLRGFVIDGVEPVGASRESIREVRAATVQLLVAQVVGYEEVGLELLLGSMVDIGWLELPGIDLQVMTDHAARVAADRVVEVGRHRELATAQELGRARDTARYLVAVGTMLQVLRWGAPNTAVLDSTTRLFHEHGLGAFTSSGLGLLDGLTLAPVIESFVDTSSYAIARSLIDAIGQHPFGDVEMQMTGMLANLKAANER